MYRDTRMWNTQLVILSAFLLLVPAISFEHPGRMHHRRPPQESAPPEDSEVDYHSEESIPWRTQVMKRVGKPRPSKENKGCLSSFRFPVEDEEIAPTCKYRVITDINPKRFPSKIHRVECEETGCRCSHWGDYRCAQLTTKMEVIFLKDRSNGSAFQETRQTIEVTYGCVCAAVKGGKAKVPSIFISRR